MSSSTNSIFTGSSTYSTDFQNLITRAVSIASLPITQLTSQKTALGNQSSEITTLASKFSSLQSALQSVDQSLSGSYSASSSDTSVVTASVSSDAVESDYSIQVSDIGAYSTMMTGTWSASGSAHTYQLYVGDQEYDVTSDDGSASSLASAINASYSSQVHATVVNVGSSSSPDYRLSLQSTKLTSATLDLRDDGTSIASVQTAGRPAQYEIDGSGVTVSSDSRTVSVATGVTLTIVGQSTSAVDVSVTRTTASLGSALSSFANAYNAVASELTAQRGSSGGALAGQSIVRELSDVLSHIATYTTTSGLSGLSALGLDLGSDGQLTYDSSALSSTATSNADELSAFLGSVSGGGFLKAANDALNSIDDSSTGLLATTQSALQSQITNLTNTIDDKQTQVDNLQTQLQQQMAAADAAIATMQQQYTYLSNMFQAMQTAAKQYS
jgi:flagellar hook-associated protein 2